MSTPAVNYTASQLTAVAQLYGSKKCDRAETEKILKSTVPWSDESIAGMDEIERQAKPAATPIKDQPPETAANATPAAVSRFRQIAEAAISRGERRVLPIEVGGKNPAISWVNGADNRIDTFTAEQWAAVADKWVDDIAARFPDLNACVVAKPCEQVFIDCDTTKEFIAGYETFSGQKFPVTYTTSARDNRTQMHFQQTDATRALGNVSQFAVGGIDLSVRQSNLYVLAEGSQHPSGSIYQRVVDASIVAMPDKLVEYIRHLKGKATGTSPDTDWLSAEKKLALIPRNSNGKMVHGNYHGAMLTVAGYWRRKGLDADAIEEKLIEYANQNFEPPVDWTKVKTMSVSICNFQPTELTMNIQSDNPAPQQTAQPAANVMSPVEIDTSEGAVRPVFPTWAIWGTSIYEGLVKPAVETSSKFEEFIFVPAMQVMLNYLSRKVNIELQPTNLNMFVGLVSPYGQFFKSTSCELAHKYFRSIGVCRGMPKNIKPGEGQVFAFQAGSPEGFGLSLSKTNSFNAIMYNDELGKFVSKAGIDSSSFSSDLLSWYGSGYFGNTVTNGKNNFAFESGTYTFGWLWCTTDRNFNRYWPKLAGMSSGIEDRMFFVVSPEKPKPAGPYSDPDLSEGALKTRALIDRALNQGLYRIEEPEVYEKRSKGLDARSFDLLKKLSLYLAVDLGLSVIDDDCLERARALVDYRNQAAAFLEPIEADNVEGRLQKEIIRELRQNKGKMPYRDMCLSLDYSRYGIRLWESAYYGLKKHGEITEFQEVRTAGKRATRMVGLVKHDENE